MDTLEEQNELLRIRCEELAKGLREANSHMRAAHHSNMYHSTPEFRMAVDRVDLVLKQYEQSSLT